MQNVTSEFMVFYFVKTNEKPLKRKSHCDNLILSHTEQVVNAYGERAIEKAVTSVDWFKFPHVI